MYYSVDHQYDTCHHLKMVLKRKKISGKTPGKCDIERINFT